MSPDQEEAKALLRKAQEDVTAISVLIESSAVADATIGFHAQQAVEKAWKAVLAARGEEFPWTHDLRFLLDRLVAIGVEVPERHTEGRHLTPWAVEFRYGESIGAEIDREGTIDLVGNIVRWANRTVSES